MKKVFLHSQMVMKGYAFRYEYYVWQRGTDKSVSYVEEDLKAIQSIIYVYIRQPTEGVSAHIRARPHLRPSFYHFNRSINGNIIPTIVNKCMQKNRITTRKACHEPCLHCGTRKEIGLMSRSDGKGWHTTS